MNMSTRSILIAAICFLVVQTGAFGAAGFKKEVKKGNLLYNEGKFDDALKHYEQALEGAPGSEVVNFNTATALYKTQQFEAAARHFEKALLADDETLQQKTQYNLGNAQYKHGMTFEDTDLERAVSLLESSLSHYERALSIDATDEDARFNYEFVEKELTRLKEKLQKQKSQQQKESKQQQSQDQKSEEKEQSGQKSQQQQGREGEDTSLQESQEQQREAQPQQSQRMPSGTEGAEERSSQDARGQDAEPMSEAEARMLLRGYQQEEEPQGLYQRKLPIGEVPEPEKDW